MRLNKMIDFIPSGTPIHVIPANIGSDDDSLMTDSKCFYTKEYITDGDLLNLRVISVSIDRDFLKALTVVVDGATPESPSHKKKREKKASLYREINSLKLDNEGLKLAKDRYEKTIAELEASNRDLSLAVTAIESLKNCYQNMYYCERDGIGNTEETSVDPVVTDKKTDKVTELENQIKALKLDNEALKLSNIHYMEKEQELVSELDKYKWAYTSMENVKNLYQDMYRECCDNKKSEVKSVSHESVQCVEQNFESAPKEKPVKPRGRNRRPRSLRVKEAKDKLIKMFEENPKLTSREACKILDIGEATFFRLKKEIRNEKDGNLHVEETS